MNKDSGKRIKLYKNSDNNNISYDYVSSDNLSLKSKRMSTKNSSDVETETYIEDGQYYVDDEGNYNYSIDGQQYTVNSEDLFDVDGKSFFVIKTNDSGSIERMISLNQSTGEVTAVSADDVWVPDSSYNRYLMAKNGDVIYNLNGDVRYARSSDVISNSNGTIEIFDRNNNSERARYIVFNK